MSLFLTNAGASLLLSGGGIPVQGGSLVQWDHDGVNVTSFAVVVDSTEYGVGLPTPSGTTYQARVPVTLTGSHTVTVYAYNGSNYVASMPATVEF